MTANPGSRPATGTGPRIEAAPAGRSLTFVIPLVVFLVIAVAFAIGLTLNPREIPSVLIGRPAPEFDLPPVKGRLLGLATGDLEGTVSLVNVWASWCVECRREHPLMMALKARGAIPVQGLNYKDQPDDAAEWLDDLGDPYERTGADIDGRVAIDWGVYGVPETFLVGPDGRIAYKHIGALTQRVLDEKILPLAEDLRRGGP